MINKDIKTIYVDADGTIFQTISKIVSLYNEDFQYYEGFHHVDWWDVDTWDFDECGCASVKQMNDYFNQPRFFNNLEFMPWAKEVLEELSHHYRIVVVSMGERPNLFGKKIWFKDNLPFVEFKGLDFRYYTNKSCIDMSDGILIDDNSKYLRNSNAKEKILFGDEYSWNRDWKGMRMANWYEIKNYLL